MRYISMLNISEVLDRSAEKWPDKRFIIFDGREVSYSDFRERVLKWASYLRRKGVKYGDIMAVFSRNRPEMLELWMAACRLGAVYSPYNFNLKVPEIRTLVSDSRPSLLFSDVPLREVGVEVIEFDNIRIEGADERIYGTAPDDLATILYTSGTEAKPKGVMNTHLNWYAALLSSVHDLDWKRTDTFLMSIPAYHVAGLYTFLGFMNVGATIVLERMPNPQEIVELIRKYEVTYLIFPPTLYIGLSQFLSEPLPKVRSCISFGAFISGTQFDAVSKILPGAQWRNYYGMTETTPMGTTLQPEDFEGKKESIGKPHINVSLRIVREDGTDTGPGETGEILMSGPTVARGYFNNVESTSNSFREGWIHTGDLALRDKDGFIYFVDRKKDIIRTGGENVSSVEVEREILRNKSVAEVSVVGLPHPYWMEAATAFVTPKKGLALSEAEILAQLSKTLAGYKVPKRIVTVETLPHNASGKILKKELREKYRDIYIGEGQ